MNIDDARSIILAVLKRIELVGSFEIRAGSPVVEALQKAADTFEELVNEDYCRHCPHGEACLLQCHDPQEAAQMLLDEYCDTDKCPIKARKADA